MTTPSLEQVLAFCARDPIERVFLEEVARRGYARFRAVENGDGLAGLCYFGANIVPSGDGCGAFAGEAAGRPVRMILGNEAAVTALWEEAAPRLQRPREDRPGQPVYAIDVPPEGERTPLRPATRSDLAVLLPACAASHEHELGYDPLEREPDVFRRRTIAQIEEGRSWLWEEGGRIYFKAEASAWTPRAVQLQQVWVDPALRNRGYAQRGLRDLCRRLLARTPSVCLFVRRDNTPAIRLYEAIGMRRVGSYRSVLF